MILPMKKVSILVLEREKEQALRELRRLGLVHIDTRRFSGEKLTQLKEQTAALEQAMQTVHEALGKKGKPQEQASAAPAEAIDAAQSVLRLSDEKKTCREQIGATRLELERFRKWGEIDPSDFTDLAERGIALSLYELLPKEYDALGDTVKTILISRDKAAARIVVLTDGAEKPDLPPGAREVKLPEASSTQLRERIESRQARIAAIEDEIRTYSRYLDAMKQALVSVRKDTSFEVYLGGMGEELLSKDISLSILNGYVPAEDMEQIRAAAKQHGWGIVDDDPTEEDSVPTKLRNNKFVSLIYPLTDFLGTVPGYFEYDISGWFLAFMLIFFGIIFGDGGYGLLIAGVAGVLIAKKAVAKQSVPPLYYLLLLFGGATILWGMLTCTWFGLAPEMLPQWLQKLSLPVISNVNSERIWYPFWTNGEVGLTTPQNVQILCFLLALVQLSVAHVKSIARNRRSLKLLGDVGALMELWGMFYIVLAMVVSSAVFPLGLILGGVPIGKVAVVLIAVGFVLNFVFASYEGSIKASILDSLKNIISMLLGIVNVFSDIVSYIRLWAVGLAGAAISATVNEMAGPLLGRLAFVVLAVFLLVFGHGLNMILNVLSVIVHGVRLNTLEFSTHLGMSWSGHKYEPFSE